MFLLFFERCECSFFKKCKTEAPLSTANGSFINEAPLYKEILNTSSDDIVLEEKSESSLY